MPRDGYDGPLKKETLLKIEKIVKEWKGANMEIKEFAELKKRLEDDIAGQVNELIEFFKIKTGYSPDSIFINMVDVSNLKNERAQFIVGSCSVDIRL